jgi:DNA-binding beta-propeller fold protein YncE
MIGVLLATLLTTAPLPTGALLDPVAPAHRVGSFPLAAVAAPEGDRVVVLLSGWRQQGLQVVDRASGAVTQTIEQPAAFIGLTFSPDGKTLFASGGNDDVVHVYRWENRRAVADGTIVLRTKKDPKTPGTSYPAGLACSPDGRTLYVAENLGDSVAVIDLASRKLVRRMLCDRYPYAVVATRDRVYVSCWGDDTVNVFHGTRRSRIDVGRHPSAMLLHRGRLYVVSASTDTIAVVDIATGNVVKRLADPPPSGPREGSTPNALVMSSDGAKLFVAEADNNAVAVFDVARGTLIGRVPTEWYPSALARSGKTIVVVNAKGRGSAPNPDYPQPDKSRPPNFPSYTLGQIDGSVMEFAETLDARQTSRRVAAANGWTAAWPAPHYPPLKHVIYIIKENRTYDQVFGDVRAGDGDPSLLYFDTTSAPNHHALAERFGLFDRFFCNAEVSPDGHNWSTAAYATDYLEKTVPSMYGSRGRTYDYEGSNRNQLVGDEDDVAAPANGYLWNLALRHRISLRNYGEFVVRGDQVNLPQPEVAVKSALAPYTCPDYPGFDLNVSDQHRVDIWMREFERYVKDGNLPTLEIIRLPNDHTAGAAADKPTPRAYMADNDLALGRIVDAVSHSQYWRDTAIFALEDDAQNGPDHVDSHRSVLLVISAYTKAGVVHRFVNTTDVLATIEDILGLGAMSHFDHFGRPLRGVFAGEADLRPYARLTPAADMKEKNPPGPAAKESARLDLSKEDAADEDLFNRILWESIKGADAPYPGVVRGALPSLLGN